MCRVDLEFSLSVRHLVYEGRYTERLCERLGYVQIGMSTFFKWSLISLLALIPPPVAVFALGIAGLSDTFFGVLEGVFFGLVFHVGFMHWFKDDDGGLAKRIEEELFIPILRRIHPRSVASPLLASLMPDSATMADAFAQVNVKEMELPGLEFFNVRVDTVIDSVIAHYGSMEEARDGLRDKRQRLATEIQQLREEHEQSITTQQELQRQFVKEKEDSEAELQRQMQQMQETSELELARHRAELEKKDAFSRNLVNSSETLSKMTKAMDGGDWLQFEMEYRAMKGMLKEMLRPSAATPELSKMLASISPIFEGSLQQAKETKRQWKRWVEFLKEEIEKADACESDSQELVVPIAKKLFSAVAEIIKRGLTLKNVDAAIENGLVLVKADEDEGFGLRVERWLTERWLPCVAKNTADLELGGRVKLLQEAIVRKAVGASKSQFGGFDFTDLESCCESVDVLQKSFLEKAEQLVEKRDVFQFTSALSQLGTMLYFLEHLEMEDQKKTNTCFLEKLHAVGQSGVSEAVSHWVREVATEYTEHSALLQEADLHDISNKDVSVVIKAMCSEERASQCAPLGDLYRIFCTLAKSWQRKFDSLAVPHHTQVFALLVFKKFLEANQDGSSVVQTLIAQVGTGEGKSMLIAELAALLALSGKRVHVVGTDPKLVVRDFESFRELFGELALTAVVCSDTRAGETASDIVANIPERADIVYCEPRHVTSFYTQNARQGDLGVSVYSDRVLILDEVDALVVDEAPSQEFVYDVGWRLIEGTQMAIGDYVTALVRHMLGWKGAPRPEEDLPQELRPPLEAKEGEQPAEKRQIFDEVLALVRQVFEWFQRPQEERDLDFRLYEGDYNDNGVNLKSKFVLVVNGKPEVHAQSNFLECLRLHENESDYQMRWYQRLFVMSKPRVFRQYEKIMGFSGTIGNAKEQRFFQDSYGAEFFLVPPFLQTCTDKANPGKDMFHTANWAGTEMAIVENRSRTICMYDGIMEKGPAGPCVVVDSEDAQFECIKGLALKARQFVPVLIIAGDTEQCKSVVRKLRKYVSGFGSINDQDMIRSLSQSDYDKNPPLYKESLKKSTQAMAGHGPKLYRITVTDPSGARGTDYQMRDEDPDRVGGLMLIVMQIPLSERDWVQYKGRTARQKWRGQYCAVLQAKEYEALEEKVTEDYEVKRVLPADVFQTVKNEGCWIGTTREKAEELAKQILAFGAEESAVKLRQVTAAYNAGFIANEVCEEVWQLWADGGDGESGDSPMTMRSKSTRRSSKFEKEGEGMMDVDVKLRGSGRDKFLKVCEDYKYLSAPEIQELVDGIKGQVGSRTCGLTFKVTTSGAPDKAYVPEERPREVKKRKVVLFVMDVSFSMQGARLDACKEQMKQLLTNKNFLAEDDCVGVVAFGKGHKELLPIGTGLQHLESVKSLVDGGQFEEAMGDRDDKQQQGLGGSTWMYQTLHTVVPTLLGDAWMPGSATEENEEPEFQRCLVVLCDGGDSRPYEFTMAHDKINDSVALVIITVGNDRSLTEQKTNLQRLVQKGSRQSLFIHADDDASAIAKAFKNVQHALSFTKGVGIVEA